MAGRPTKYDEGYPERARKMCLLGATNDEMATMFGVHVDTIKEWMNVHEAFAEAVRAGKAEADADVAERLYRRALGYSHPAVKIMAVGGEIEEVAYTEHYPPDTTACIFWLKNRQRAKWRDKPEDEGDADKSIKVTGGLPD